MSNLPTTISVVNQKGGVGKTTLVALLSYGLYELGHKVLMIDMDPQAHLSSFFIKVSEMDRIPGSLHMAKGERFELVKLLSGKGRCLHLMPSKLSYLLEAYSGAMPITDPFAVDKRLKSEPALRKYDFIIFDTPPELFIPTKWALFASDYLVIPVNYEELSIMGARILIKDVLPDVFMYSKRDVKVLGIVLTNVVRRISMKSIQAFENRIKRFLSNAVARSLHPRFYEKMMFETVIYRYDKLRDLVYRPRRWETPIFRIVKREEELHKVVTKLASELLLRVKDFRGMGQ